MNSSSATTTTDKNKNGSSFVEALSKLLKSEKKIFSAPEIRKKLNLQLGVWNRAISLAKFSDLGAKHGIAFGGRNRSAFYYHTDYPELASSRVAFIKKKSDGFLESGEVFSATPIKHPHRSLLVDEVPHLKTNLEIKSTEDLRKIRRQARDVCLQAHEILMRREREVMESLF